MRTNVALAAGMCLALTTVSASAQGPSYEGRGYGGPLYVGPNFEQGGQHSPPAYGTKPAKKRVPAAHAPESTKIRKAPAEKPAEKEVVTEKPATADTLSSTEKEPATDVTPEAAASSTTCKKYDATSGQTITVPCE